MAEAKEDKNPTLDEVIEKQKNDTSWKKPAWVNQKDGYLYRRNRVKNANGTYTEFDVRVGKKPIIEPKGK